MYVFLCGFVNICVRVSVNSRHIGFPGIRVTSAFESLVMSAGNQIQVLCRADCSLNCWVISPTSCQFLYYNLKSKCFWNDACFWLISRILEDVLWQTLSSAFLRKALGRFLFRYYLNNVRKKTEIMPPKNPKPFKSGRDSKDILCIKHAKNC